MITKNKRSESKKLKEAEKNSQVKSSSGKNIHEEWYIEQVNIMTNKNI